jgi:ketosteroid isomerase-like protein
MTAQLGGAVMTDELPNAIERYHAALRAFARGDASVVKKDFSRADDIVLANPFGPAVVGWAAASEWMDFASSRFRDGDVPQFEELTRQASGDLVVLHETEHWQARVAGGSEVEGPWTLRVTTVFRREKGEWRIALRHADPIATVDPRGPLRGG